MELVDVDLSNWRTTKRELKKDEKYFIGGKGIGFRVFSEYTHSDVIIFATGPLTGLKLSGMARCEAIFKSPQTDFIAESSCGGFFGAELRRAGYIALLVRGRSETPALLKIENEEVELVNASHLWGMNTFDAEDTIKADYGRKFKIACIGQAGEKLVKFACIEHAKGREFGRCGGGAVMGSMNLKAIAVRGDNDLESEIADSDKYEELKENIESRITEGLKGLTETGTPRMIPIVNEAGVLPSNYWEDGEFDDVEEIMNNLNRIHFRKRACYSCRVACGKISKFRGKEVDGPEYETLFSFGTLCNIRNVEDIAEFNLLCDKYGMDTISAGNIIAYQLRKSGKLGDRELIFDLLDKIAFRKGEGDKLAEGIKHLDKIHVKGLELPGYDPRGLYGTALGYAVCYRGGCHIKHVMHRPNLMGELDRLKPDGQAELLVHLEDFYGFTDSLVMCRFITLPNGVLKPNDVSELYCAVTGEYISEKDLLHRGRGVVNLARKINETLGLTRDDDALPEFFFKKPIGKGNSQGRVVGFKDFKKMLDEYYALRGWK
jgi:aldehyde:ferredoxin oxidoreductase